MLFWFNPAQTSRAVSESIRPGEVDDRVKKIGFLSFGHWAAGAGSRTRSASDALLQSIELAVAAEELGADGAYFRVHHFARQLGSPSPCWPRWGRRLRGSRSVPLSSTCATRTPCTSSRTQAPPT